MVERMQRKRATDHGILFGGPMIRALLTGVKRETRRIVKPQPPNWVEQCGFTCFTPPRHFSGRGSFEARGPAESFMPLRYCFGDALWVREAYWSWGRWETTGFASKTGRPEHRFRPIGRRIVYGNPGPAGPIAYFKTSMGAGAGNAGWVFRPGIHMPRWASRITLTVKAVRVERLHEITRAGAIAEGLQLASAHIEEFFLWPEPYAEHMWLSPREAYRFLWNTLHGADAWDANPWVVVTMFSVRLGNIDA